MKVAREGLPFIAIAWIIEIALVALGWYVAAIIWLPIAIWVVAFFRDPSRDKVRDEQAVLAPADGKIVSIVPIHEPTFLGASTTRIAIFMNVLNVHVNRYPVSGVVGYRQYRSGKFFHAAAEKSSDENEQSSTGVENSRGKILVRQIAGTIARRIVTDHREGTTVAQGQRLGLIRFGSRVDVFIPADAEITVKVGDKTRAGETIIARWKS